MKRIVMLLSVVALMVVMLAMSVAPAFADQGPMPLYGCTLYASDGSVVDYDTVQANQVHFYKKYGYTCVK